MTPFSQVLMSRLWLALGATLTFGTGLGEPLTQDVKVSNDRMAAVLLHSVFNFPLLGQGGHRVVSLLSRPAVLILLPGCDEGLDNPLDQGLQPPPHF